MAHITLLDSTRRIMITVNPNPALIKFLMGEGIVITASRKV